MKISQLFFGVFVAIGALGISGTLPLISAAPLHLLAAPASLDNTATTSSLLKAIVQLEGMDVAPPQITGQGVIPLQQYRTTQVFTVMLDLGGELKPFLLDTGATTTMLAPEVVEKLQLSGRPVPNQRLDFAVAGDGCPNMNAQLFSLPPFSLQKIRVEGLSGLMLNHTTMPPGLAGVLGMDVLRYFDLEIAPQIPQVTFRPPQTLTVEQKSQAVSLQKKSGVMLAQLMINQKGPFTVLVDTGAGSTFISPQVATQVGLDDAPQQALQIQGFCGLEDAVRSQLASVQLGQFEQNEVDTIILSSSILEVLEVDGILGQNFLNHYQQSWHFGTDDEAIGYLQLTPIR